jgi:hypothetical protein
LAAFGNCAVARGLSSSIDAGLLEPGAADVSLELRKTPRLVERNRCAWLLPTVVHCERAEHALANREFLFPFAAVVECAEGEIAERIGPTLVASVCGSNPRLIDDLRAASQVDRLNLGPIPTCQVSWDQPHEGNLFSHLYRQRAFQTSQVA